jgi:arylsulfatase
MFNAKHETVCRHAGQLAGRLDHLKVDVKVVDTEPMARTLPTILQRDESFDIGADTLTGVDDADDQPPFALTARLNKPSVRLDRPQLSPADIARLQAAMRNKD